MNNELSSESNPPKKKMGLMKKILIGIGGLLIISSLLPKGNGTSAVSSSVSSSDTLIRCYVVSSRILKSGLKDPDSFEEITESRNFIRHEKGDKDKTYVQVTIKYRAKNSFAGYVVNKQGFNFDKNLNLIDSFEMDL